MQGTLFIVATPIGNLEDITLPALEILKSVDLILCEDTRVSGKLLAEYKIQTQMKAYHQHSDQSTMREIREMLEAGKNLALVTDAGTPGISDPGNLLISYLVSDFGLQVIVSVPGPSAVIAALSI